MSNAQETILDELRTTFLDLIEHYAGLRVPLEQHRLTGLECRHASSIGFGDDDFRGCLTLMTDANSPQSLGCHEDGCTADWLGELGNQWVGRFKNKISQYGRLINMGLPVRLSGEDLVLAAGDQSHWTIRWNGDHLVAQIELEVEDSLVLEFNDESATAEEGSLCLF